MDTISLNNCREKVGMLVLRDCGKPAAALCKSCGVPLCKKHTVTAVDGIICLSCAQKDVAAAPLNANQPVMQERARRDYWYDAYPYYATSGYYHHSYYHDRDYNTFDNRDETAVGAREAAEDKDSDAGDSFES